MFAGSVGFLDPRKTHGSREALAVATPAIFMRRGELKKVMAHFHENAVLGGGSRSVATLMALTE